MSTPFQDFVFTELFLQMHCDKNYDQTQNLILRGNDLFKKIGQRLRDRDLVIISIYLRKHPEIIALDFPYNEITDCGMCTLVQYIMERPVIRYLNLIGNRIGARGIRFLQNLGSFLPLYTLRLTGNKLGPEGGKCIAEILQKKNALKFLDISDTDQTMSSLAYLMTALMPSRGGTDSLEYVDISRPLPQEYHQIHSAHYAEFLGQVLKDNHVLKEIHVQQYGFDFRDVEIMLDGLSANKTLVVLDLNNNNIGDDGVEYICKYLKNRPPLECLMIAVNKIGDLGAQALGFNLPYSNIRLLDISNNKITDVGLLSIFHTIKKEPSMKGLFFWGNKITHKSLIVLQRLFNSGLLEPNHTDVRIFCVDKELRAAWNAQANRYTHRFYCVSDYGFPPIRKPIMVQLPLEKPIIHYRHHVDRQKMGEPVSDWEGTTVKHILFDSY